MIQYDRQDYLYWRDAARRRIRREQIIDEALAYGTWALVIIGVVLVLALT